MIKPDERWRRWPVWLALALEGPDHPLWSWATLQGVQKCFWSAGYLSAKKSVERDTHVRFVFCKGIETPGVTSRAQPGRAGQLIVTLRVRENWLIAIFARGLGTYGDRLVLDMTPPEVDGGRTTIVIAARRSRLVYEAKTLTSRPGLLDPNGEPTRRVPQARTILHPDYWRPA